MRTEETHTTTDPTTGSTHTEVVREREVNTISNGAGATSSVVALFAIIAIVLGGWFLISAFSGDGDGASVMPDEVNVDVIDPSGGEG